MHSRHFYITLLLILSFSSLSTAQHETITNSRVIEMIRSGLGEDIVIAKIRKSAVSFNIDSTDLVELKKAGVPDQVILLMIERQEEKGSIESSRPASSPVNEIYNGGDSIQIVAPRDAIGQARTIALSKSSVQPSRQALEKELLKRPEWKALDLTLERYKDRADLYVEIGYVPMSWITHRYVYRIYDRRSGTILAAGETTSWGSLAENLAKHIARDLAKISRG